MSDRNFVMRKLIQELTRVDSRENAVIVDGKYLLWSQKSVYVEMDGVDKLNFFIREKDTEGAHATKKTYVTDEVFDAIYRAIISPVLGDYHYDGIIPDVYCNICVDSELNFLIIESSLYHIARETIYKNVSRPEIQASGLSLSVQEVSALIAAFKRISYCNFSKLIFSKTQRRVLNRCYKRHPFFNIMHAFIPVVISYKYIYNPLLDDPTDQIFSNSKLMRVAIDNNRKIEVNDSLYCYMLTHEEICECLGLSSFMRFTPEFLYKFCVGLLHPELESFPSKTRTIYVRSADGESYAGYSTTYAEDVFDKLLSSMASRVSGDISEDEKNQLNKELLALSSYMKVDTLYYEVAKNRHQLVSIGNAQLEGKVSADMLYDILMEGNLLLEG